MTAPPKHTYILNEHDVISRYGVKTQLTELGHVTHFDCRKALLVASATHELVRMYPNAAYIVQHDDQVETLLMIVQWMIEDDRQENPEIAILRETEGGL